MMPPYNKFQSKIMIFRGCTIERDESTIFRDYTPIQMGPYVFCCADSSGGVGLWLTVHTFIVSHFEKLAKMILALGSPHTQRG